MAALMNDACATYMYLAVARADPSEPRQSLVGVKLYPPHKHSLGKVFKGTSLKKAWRGVRSIAKC